VDTITDSHGYNDKKDSGVDNATYRFSGKVIDPTVCSLLCHRMVDHQGSGSGVTGYDVSVKVAQLNSAPQAPRPGKQP